jgi:hypothetical protein
VERDEETKVRETEDPEDPRPETEPRITTSGDGVPPVRSPDRNVISGEQRFITSLLTGGDILAPARATATRPASGRRSLNWLSVKFLVQPMRATFTSSDVIPVYLSNLRRHCK